MGATVSCLVCEGKTFHLDYTVLENLYLPFEHHSGKYGPVGDKTIFVLHRLV